jgi:hypothetical protein
MASQQPKELGAIVATPAWAEVYNVPDVSGDYAAISTLCVCNFGTAVDYFYIATDTHSNTPAPGNAQLRFSKVLIQPGETYAKKWSWMLHRNKAVVCKSQNGTCSVAVSGIEYS